MTADIWADIDAARLALRRADRRAANLADHGWSRDCIAYAAVTLGACAEAQLAYSLHRTPGKRAKLRARLCTHAAFAVDWLAGVGGVMPPQGIPLRCRTTSHMVRDLADVDRALSLIRTGEMSVAGLRESLTWLVLTTAAWIDQLDKEVTP